MQNPPPTAPGPETPPADAGPRRTAADFDHLVDEDIPPDFFEAAPHAAQGMFGLSRRTSNLVIAGVIALVIAVIAFFVFATIFGWWPVVLDIVLVVAALTTTALLGILIYILIVLARLGRELRDEIVPVVRTLGAAGGAVAETARAATGYGVRPATHAVGLLSSTLGAARFVFGSGQARIRAQARQRRRDEIAREMNRHAQEELDREIGHLVRGEATNGEATAPQDEAAR